MCPSYYLLYYFGNNLPLSMNNPNVSFAQILILLNIKEYNYCIIKFKEVKKNWIRIVRNGRRYTNTNTALIKKKKYVISTDIFIPIYTTEILG